MSDNRQNPPIQTLTEETPANANLVAKLEPTTPNLRLPLPGYTLDVDLARIRDAFLKVDALSVSLEDNNEQAAATADDALEVAAQAKREAERAKATAAEAVSIAESKATAADVEAHNQTKDAHGATSEPEPGSIALRDEFGRIKAEAPEADKDAANKGYVDTGLADAANDLSSHVASTAAHGAATAATANSIAMRTAGGRLSVGAPSATNHAATKAYVDSGIANITNPGIAKAWATNNSGNLYGHNVVSLVSDQINQHTITLKPGVFSDATKMAAVAFVSSGEVYIGSLTTSTVFIQTLNSSGNNAIKRFTVIVFEGK